VTEAGAVHRVVIVGAGFGGLFAAKFLRRAPVQATLVDRTNHHVFQPLLYHVATGILSSGEIAPATRDVLHKHANVAVELGEVTGFDLDARQVMVTRPGGRAVTLAYDSLIVAAGVGGSYFGHDEFEQWAPGMKTLADALAQRERIFGAFELAELEQDAETRKALLTFAVVGGGPTGVEIAGQIAELAHRALQGNFRNFDPESVRVVLFDGGKEILANFGDKLSAKAAHGLEQTGVEIHTGSIVTSVDADGVEVKGPDGEITRYAAKTTIWAAGVQASPLAKMLAQACGAECDRAGRIRVLPDCSLPGHPEVFAVGDMMNLNDLPGVAEVAMQTGIHAARTITKRVESGAESTPFKYRDLGSMAAISRRRAIVSFHGLRVSGWLGWMMWMFVHLAFMTGFKNRFTAGLHWMMAFGGRGRPQRAIVGDEIGDG
jgi:NADH dehydrogenase